MAFPNENPIYLLPQDKKRAIIPKIMILIVLSAIFYLGVLLNVALLELNAKQETGLKTGFLLFLLVLIVVGIVLAILQARQPYRFYRERIFSGKNSVAYIEIVNTVPNQDLWDKLFKTYTLNLSPKVHLRHLAQEIQVQEYLQKLIAYNRNRRPNITSS